MAAELDVEYTRFEAFFEPKSKGGGISAIGTVDERNPVADDVGFGAAAEDALAGGAFVFAIGLDPPHAITGKKIKLQTAKARRIGPGNRSRFSVRRNRELPARLQPVSPRVILVDANRPEKSAIDEGVALLRNGGLVAFPTETVYGLGARALDRAAVARIFEAKGRPATHPIIAHVLDEDGAKKIASTWNDLASQLARAFWPGPLTIVAPKRAEIPDELTGGGNSVGIRAPVHPVARALIGALGEPIAAPSANRFQQISPTLAAHVVKSLGDRVDLILDGGSCARGIESTVVSISEANEIHLLRPGSISIEALSEHAKVVYENKNAAEGETRASPGMDAKHYAPRTRLLVAPREDFEKLAAGKKVGVILQPNSAIFDAFATRVLPNDAAGFATALFATLHELDDLQCDLILVEAPPSTGDWIAVRDRLTRASGH
jgi:L-threonylcarbamoyladenylate synthase